MNETTVRYSRPPLIGEPAPDFRARTTMGECSLADYRGKWLHLFSHPADFTPVCTSEFIELAKAAPQFKAMNCSLLGLSIDSLFSHLAWMRSIQENFDVSINFPIVEDISMAMARAYGMIHPDSDSTATVRASFLIDPLGTIRATFFYPMSTGRNVAETLRLLAALQENDATGHSTPANWRPGEPTILAPPMTMEAATSRESKSPDAWYFQREPGRVKVES
ncbi:MAG: peroxiredoxin [Rhodospirillales bacterium 20-60-12]|nr:MAG: peroxiredoxin [Rhodospirillales bacterium 20-60-12]HQT68781.1 peroxiredoxin [Acetobacteraceae bacterium]